MRLRRTVINHSSKLGRALGLLLTSTVLIVSFVASSPSLSKYVLDSVGADLTFFSADFAQELVAEISILGTTRQYETLTATVVTDEESTYTIQWQRANSLEGEFIDIPDATLETFYLDIENNNHYIRVAVKGTGEYSGTVYSSTVGPVVVAAIDLESMGAIQGNAVVGQTVTAGSLLPTGATATYQWKIADTLNGTYVNISGATNITLLLTESMIDKFVRVYATGSNTYSGTEFASMGPIISDKIQITDLDPIVGTTTIGNTLTAGPLTPSGAEVTYQWQRSDTSGSIFSNIEGATSSTYVPVNPEDLNRYVRVVATGTGDYSGTVTSVRSGPVVTAGISLTAPVTITGTAQVGQTLTVEALAPSGATASYQWYFSDNGSAPWNIISGATGNTYTIAASYFGKHLRVTVTGSGSYTGTLDSNALGPVAAMPLQSIGNISGSAIQGQVVTAGTVLPSGATVDYQWRRYSTTNPSGSYTVIGANSSTYTLSASDVNTYIRVAAIGTGAYNGTVLSQYIVPSAAGTTLTHLSSIADSIGLTQVFQTLTAGTVSPYGATVTYQWLKSSSMDGIYLPISGATSQTLVLTGADKGFYFKVTATGSGLYTGSVTSRYAGPITAAPLMSISNISGTATNGQLLTAGTVLPSGATVNFQWLRSDINGENYIPIAGANSNTYQVTETDIGLFIKVQATGINLYSGTVTSQYSGPVVLTPTNITAVGTISGTAQVGQMLTAGNTTPLGATVTYQWSRADVSGGPYTAISGANSATYTTTAADLNKYFKVTVWGSGVYATPPSGITSAFFGPVLARPLESISNVIGKTQVGQVLTAGTVLPIGANVSYQWKYSDNTSIVGETSNTYIITSADLGKSIKVSVTGNQGYFDTVSSISTGPVVTGDPNLIQGIGDITGITQVGQILTAGVVFPYGATVSYQWLRSGEIDGTYEAISGATQKTYTLTGADHNKYMRVIATGFGLYYDEVRSNATDKIMLGTVDSVGNILGQTIVGQPLSSGGILPVGATVTYQWKRSSDGVSYTNIPGATLSSYLLTEDDLGKTIKLFVTGTGSYEGTAESQPTLAIQPSGTVPQTITMGGFTPSGTLSVGDTVTIGTVGPSGATYSVQWQRSEDNINFSNISGAINTSYVLTANDFEKYVRPVVTGTGAYTGVVTVTGRLVTGMQTITAVANIIGTPALSELVLAGEVTPAGAAVTYQWMYTSSRTPLTATFYDITGATDYYYKFPDEFTTPTGQEKYYYKVRVSGDESKGFTGSVDSYFFGPLKEDPSKITAISPIVGDPTVSNLLSAGTTTPFGASVTYQWYRRAANAETYSAILGATASTYRLTDQDFNHYLKVVITGSGGYYGWAESEPTSLIGKGALAALSSISGSRTVGSVVTAGAITPVSATATYTWMRASTLEGSYSAIDGANTETYTLTTEDLTSYIKVKVEGTGFYTGTITSSAIGPVIDTPLTSVTNVVITESGNRFQVNRTLNATSVSPSGATVTYQWYRSNTSGGTYIPIPGATASTYYTTVEDYLKYIKVEIAGTGNFGGVFRSNATAQIGKRPITRVGEYTPAGEQSVNQSLVAFSIDPAEATVTYQWEISQGGGGGGGWNNIGVSTQSVLIPDRQPGNNASTVGRDIRVIITGTGAYTGTLGTTGTTVDIVAYSSLETLEAMGSIVGTSAVGQTLTAGAITPSGASAFVDYQWQRSLTPSGTFQNIAGATTNSYTIPAGDLNYYLRVVATGTGNYSGVLTSASTGPVISSGSFIQIASISDILYTTVPQLTLTAGTVSPMGATVTYQWKVASSLGGTYSNISGATSSVYTIPVNQALGSYFKVEVTGSGSYSGTALSNATGPVVVTPEELTSVQVSGINKVGETLSAVNLTAENLWPGDTYPTATYQWQVFTGPGGVFADIPGATGSTYTLQPAQYNYYVRVIATGSGAYTGSKFADTTSKIIGLLSSAQVTMASPVLGATPQTAAQVQSTTNHPDYEVTGLVWNEALTPLGKFKAGTAYTATVTLTSKNTKIFVSTPFTPMVASAASVGTTTTSGSDVGNTVSFTATFAPTGALMPTSISVTTQPTKLVYVETTDGVLALDGMVVTETNNDGTITTTIFTDGTAAGYTASPEDGSTLTGAQHDSSVTITHTASGKTATTANLFVEAPPSASNVTITGTAAANSALTGNYSYYDVNGDAEDTDTTYYEWFIDSVSVSAGAGSSYLSYTLTAADIGKTVLLEVTPAAASGSSTGAAVTSTTTLPVATNTITSASVNIVAPVLGTTPDTLENVETQTANDDYTVTGLTWNEALTAAGKFKADTVYTATVTLTSKNDSTFQWTFFTPTVTTASSVGTTTTSGLGIGNTVTFTVSFPQTGALAVDSLSIQAPPSDMSYVEMTDATLSLNGLVVTATHNDGSQIQVPFTDGVAAGYTADPAHGTVLTNADHDGQPITITHTDSSKTATTSNLAVQAQVAPVASSVSISGTAQVGQPLNGSYEYYDANSDSQGTSTFKWYADAVEIPSATTTTYVVQAGDVGKVIRFEVTPFAATGLTPGNPVQSDPTEAVVPN